MNKKICRMILAFGVIAIFASQVWAMERRPAPKKAGVVLVSPGISKATGKVTGYSWSNSTLTISVNGGSSLTITSDKNTSISKGRKYVKLTDIKTGDIVTVTHENKKGQNIAKSIVVQEKSAAINKNKR